MSIHMETLDPELGGQYRPSWFWFLGAGVALLGLGVLAFGHLIVASMISTFVIGAIMLIGGALGVAHALGIRHPDKHHFWIFSSVFYGLAGITILVEPVFGERLLTLVLAISLGLSGLSRLVVGGQLRSNSVLISGAASLMAAAAIGVDWTQDALWVIGFCIAIDLVIQGLTLLFTGIVLRLAPRPVG
ncbi:DUF308 domain-containing protein [Sphingomonadaceae bacterium G21617-S1]|jgi:uncharacterized membrane protein HdeD (DUF308 family)|uniref:HdeD family acid-resistance protein n=1 Tax=Rhizorhabdus sp. TaxID=1968843 RepID=UPI0019B84F11|nr:DUF308 domain-containing protein [Rhizorhabdus sp.]MBD3761907.1 DUF308 domain-containing protein [Rhizorhabdus sp.]MCZ4341094.1 DUF308 domain-containing protein [Sphingomonadaceae bacterium G21617-S1]